jgi:hypothetical protein
MIDDMIGGPASSTASHCVAKSGSVKLPASGATSGPQLLRKFRTASSAGLSRLGVGSGIQGVELKCTIAGGAHVCGPSSDGIGLHATAPQPPNPPALATAIASEAGETLPIGAIKIGTRRLNVSQNALARARAGWLDRLRSLYEMADFGSRADIGNGPGGICHTGRKSTFGSATQSRRRIASDPGRKRYR